MKILKLIDIMVVYHITVSVEINLEENIVDEMPFPNLVI